MANIDAKERPSRASAVQRRASTTYVALLRWCNLEMGPMIRICGRGDVGIWRHPHIPHVVGLGPGGSGQIKLTANSAKHFVGS